MIVKHRKATDSSRRKSLGSRRRRAFRRNAMAMRYKARNTASHLKTELKMLITSSTATFLLGTTAYLGIRAWYKRKLATKKASSQSTAMDKFLIAFVVLGQVVLPLLAILSPLLKWADYALYPIATVAGAAVMISGVWLFWRSHADLGKNWSVSLELEAEHQLVTSGIYSWVRHPMYASFFVMALAQLLLVPNGLAGPAALLAVSVLYYVRRPTEEAMLTEYFGLAYTRYVASTGGIFPRLRGAHSRRPATSDM